MSIYLKKKSEKSAILQPPAARRKYVFPDCLVQYNLMTAADSQEQVGCKEGAAPKPS